MNIEQLARLDMVLEIIKDKPEQWDQSEWAKQVLEGDNYCGTALCVAGWIGQLDGGQPIWNEIGEADRMRFPDGSSRLIEMYAVNRLGITRDDGDELFNGENSYDDLLEVRNQLAEKYHGEISDGSSTDS